MSSNIHIFTHHDLDGIGSLLALIWAFPDANITYTTASNSQELASKFNEKAFQENSNKYSKIFVTDISIQQKDADVIDRENLIYIDHHISSLGLNFKKAHAVIKDYSSCAMLIFKVFKDKLVLTTQQKQLLIYIDDYDSFQLKFQNSWNLNCLFWEMYTKNISEFLDNYHDGFKEFTSLQSNIVNIYKQKLQQAINSLQMYQANINVQGSICSIGAAFADFAINDVATHLINKLNKDIAIIVNLKTNRVSFRKSKKCNANMSILAQSLCDGAGHMNAAGGAITDKFMKFTQLLK